MCLFYFFTFILFGFIIFSIKFNVKDNCFAFFYSYFYFFFWFFFLGLIILSPMSCFIIIMIYHFINKTECVFSVSKTIHFNNDLSKYSYHWDHFKYKSTHKNTKFIEFMFYHYKYVTRIIFNRSKLFYWIVMSKWYFFRFKLKYLPSFHYYIKDRFSYTMNEIWTKLLKKQVGKFCKGGYHFVGYNKFWISPLTNKKLSFFGIRKNIFTNINNKKPHSPYKYFSSFFLNSKNYNFYDGVYYPQIEKKKKVISIIWSFFFYSFFIDNFSYKNIYKVFMMIFFYFSFFFFFSFCLYIFKVMMNNNFVVNMMYSINFSFQHSEFVFSQMHSLSYDFVSPFVFSVIPLTYSFFYMISYFKIFFLSIWPMNNSIMSNNFADKPVSFMEISSEEDSFVYPDPNSNVEWSIYDYDWISYWDFFSHKMSGIFELSQESIDIQTEGGGYVRDVRTSNIYFEPHISPNHAELDVEESDVIEEVYIDEYPFTNEVGLIDFFSKSMSMFFFLKSFF